MARRRQPTAEQQASDRAVLRGVGIVLSQIQTRYNDQGLAFALDMVDRFANAKVDAPKPRERKRRAALSETTGSVTVGKIAVDYHPV